MNPLDLVLVHFLDYALPLASNSFQNQPYLFLAAHFLRALIWLPSDFRHAPMQAWLEEDMARSAARYGPESFSRNPFSEDTDTRFETDSDVMELAELAEIL